jgi:AcrR family transcriptional regulator
MSIAPLLTGALAGSRPVSEHETDNRIMDAVVAELCETPLRKLSLEDVADRAGLTRMTVYRRFGDRAALVETLGVRECRRCLADLDAALDLSAEPAEQVADGFVAAMRIAREHPLLNRLARIEPEAIVGALTADGGAVFTLMREFAAARLLEGSDLDRTGALEASEVLVRLCISFVLVQDSAVEVGDEDAARAFARRALAPVVQ